MCADKAFRAINQHKAEVSPACDHVTPEPHSTVIPHPQFFVPPLSMAAQGWSKCRSFMALQHGETDKPRIVDITTACHINIVAGRLTENFTMA